MSGESPYRVWAITEGARAWAAERVINDATDSVSLGVSAIDFKTKWPDAVKPVEKRKGEWKVVVVEPGEPISALEPVEFAQRMAHRLMIERLKADPNRAEVGAPPRNVAAYAINTLHAYVRHQPGFDLEPYTPEAGTIAALGGTLSMSGPSYKHDGELRRCYINWPPGLEDGVDEFKMPEEMVEYRNTFEKAFAAEFERLSHEELERFRARIVTAQDKEALSELWQRNMEVAELVRLMIQRPDLVEKFRVEGRVPDKDKRRAAWHEVNSTSVPFPDK